MIKGRKYEKKMVPLKKHQNKNQYTNTCKTNKQKMNWKKKKQWAAFTM